MSSTRPPAPLGQGDKVRGRMPGHAVAVRARAVPLRFQTAKWATDFVATKMSGDLDGRNVFAASEAYLALGD
jgi:hypothetical protein